MYVYTRLFKGEIVTIATHCGAHALRKFKVYGNIVQNTIDMKAYCHKIHS